MLKRLYYNLQFLVYFYLTTVFKKMYWVFFFFVLFSFLFSFDCTIDMQDLSCLTWDQTPQPPTAKGLSPNHWSTWKVPTGFLILSWLNFGILCICGYVFKFSISFH